MWNTDSEGVGVCIQGILGFGWHILAFGDRSGTADILWSIVLSMGEYTLLTFVWHSCIFTSCLELQLHTSFMSKPNSHSNLSSWLAIVQLGRKAAEKYFHYIYPMILSFPSRIKLHCTKSCNRKGLVRPLWIDSLPANQSSSVRILGIHRLATTQHSIRLPLSYPLLQAYEEWKRK